MSTVILDGNICTNACLSYGETDITPDYLGRFGPAFGDLRGQPFELVITNGNSYSLTINSHTVSWQQGDPHIAIEFSGGWTTSFTPDAFKWTDQAVNAYGIAVAETLYGCPTDPPFTPGVPEPGTWALLLMGFALLAFVARRRSRPSRLRATAPSLAALR
jgi:hypothetical protein